MLIREETDPLAPQVDAGHERGADGESGPETEHAAAENRDGRTIGTRHCDVVGRIVLRWTTRYELRRRQRRATAVLPIVLTIASLVGVRVAAAELSPSVIEAFDRYVEATEDRMLRARRE